MTKTNLIKSIVETGILVALAVVLDILFKLVPVFNMPQGGHISLCMLPIIIIGFRRGLKFGLAGAILYAIINFMFDGFVWHVGSIFFDYIFAFGILGLSGLSFLRNSAKTIWKMCLIIFILCFLRYVFHGLSGVLFFAEYAYIPEGYNWTVSAKALPWVYSFIIYNLPYMGISTIICIVVAIALHPVMYLALDDNNNGIKDELEEQTSEDVPEEEVTVYQKDEDAIKNKRER